MSAEAVGWVWRHSTYTGSVLLCQLAVADVVNDAHGNELWMAVDNLAAKARVSRSSAFEAIKTMVDDGYLQVVEKFPGQRIPSRYRVQILDSTSPASGPNTKEITNDSLSPDSGLVAAVMPDGSNWTHHPTFGWLPDVG